MKTPTMNQLQSADTRIYQWCARRKHRERIARLAWWISKTGDGPLYALGATLLALLEPASGGALLLTALFAYAIDVPLYLWLKARIRRPRPFTGVDGWRYQRPERALAARSPSRLLWREVEDEFSFPSGHTAAAMVWALLIAIHYPAFAGLALVWALLVGVSRVLLGVHYPGDILAGLVLGSGAAGVALLLVERFGTGLGQFLHLL
jgi:undecaprenyl-diphosphatase